jgi:hypothetical protein
MLSSLNQHWPKVTCSPCALPVFCFASEQPDDSLRCENSGMQPTLTGNRLAISRLQVWISNEQLTTALHFPLEREPATSRAGIIKSTHCYDSIFKHFLQNVPVCTRAQSCWSLLMNGFSMRKFTLEFHCFFPCRTIFHTGIVRVRISAPFRHRKQHYWMNDTNHTG